MIGGSGSVLKNHTLTFSNRIILSAECLSAGFEGELEETVAEKIFGNACIEAYALL